jgi:hypothetical protein
LNEPTIAQTVLFADLADRPLIATFDQPHASSDGAILLKRRIDTSACWRPPRRSPMRGVGARDPASAI